MPYYLQDCLKQPLFAALCLFLLAGCSDRPRMYPVSGVVSFDNGEPARNASIEFVPQAPGPSPRGRVTADGTFDLGTFDNADGAPAGDYQVVIIQVVSPEAGRMLGQDLGPEHAAHAGAMRLVSMKHSSPHTSGITATVKPGEENNFKFIVEAAR